MKAYIAKEPIFREVKISLDFHMELCVAQLSYGYDKQELNLKYFVLNEISSVTIN